ncbi:hypothetical protein Pogu_0812 [Pyrobaculum oguniense TE7]|uniref:Uncharacterized protein n=1 Tax=Pyrobaculum oguniense (strain DSM 13380 / JCM 10595 / TE7) TaxID=698757 RepID=H6Q9K5_PYROT|nr:hypothetical protein Pogu_0812 [Pyrobaculum oguniense TE7]
MNAKLWIAIAAVVIIAIVGALVVFQRPSSQTPPRTTSTAAPPLKGNIYVIYDIGGRGDLSFNDMAERLGIYVHKSVVAEILKVSKFTIKDTAWRLRQYLQKEAEAEKALHSGGYDLRLCSGVRKVGGGGRGEDCAVDATFENDAFFVPFL